MTLPTEALEAMLATDHLSPEVRTITTELLNYRKAEAWLTGSAPDPDGNWFGDFADFPADHPKPRGSFWWRVKFREIAHPLTEALRAQPTSPGKEPDEPDGWRLKNFRGVGYTESEEDWRKSYQTSPSGAPSDTAVEAALAENARWDEGFTSKGPQYFVYRLRDGETDNYETVSVHPDRASMEAALADARVRRALTAAYAIDRPLASKQDAGSGERHTFAIPDGHEAVLDAAGRATGETRPKWDARSGEAWLPMENFADPGYPADPVAILCDNGEVHAAYWDNGQYDRSAKAWERRIRFVNHSGSGLNPVGFRPLAASSVAPRVKALIEAAKEILMHAGIHDAAPDDVDAEDYQRESVLRKALAALEASPPRPKGSIANPNDGEDHRDPRPGTPDDEP